MKKKEEFLYDVRIANRNIREGLITKKDYDKHISSLPDVKGNSEPIVIEDENEKGRPEAGHGEE